MKKFTTYMLLSFLFIVSCKQTKTIETYKEKSEKAVERPYNIDLEKNLDKIEPVLLSSIGKELEYIPLETTPKSIIGRINQIFLNETYIFISDFNKLLQFDRTGKFIRQVGSNPVLIILKPN